MEQEARLAAEIGQTLLEKHGALKHESAQLEKQLAVSHDKTRHLERLLQEQDSAMEDLSERHNRANWERHKAEQTLRETEADLEMANARNSQLMNDLKAKASELRSTRIALHQADTREQNTRAKLEDTKQELIAAQRSERAIESKHKKLRARYDMLHSAYERLKLEQQEVPQVAETDDLAWLRESNERLRSEMLRLSLSLEPSEKHQQQQQQHIRELESSNQELTTELVECRERLADTQAQLDAMRLQMEKLLLVSSQQEQSIVLAQQPNKPASLPVRALPALVHHHHHILHHNNVKCLQDAAVQTQSDDTEKHVLERLRSTDMRTLNRSLNRAFDIKEMNETSNGMIQSILSEMRPKDGISRDMLTEIGQLRMTINDLQLAYVNKVQEQEEKMIKQQQCNDEEIKESTPTAIGRFMDIVSSTLDSHSLEENSKFASVVPSALGRLQSWTTEQVMKTRHSMLRPPSVDHTLSNASQN